MLHYNFIFCGAPERNYTWYGPIFIIGKRTEAAAERQGKQIQVTVTIIVPFIPDCSFNVYLAGSVKENLNIVTWLRSVPSDWFWSNSGVMANGPFHGRLCNRFTCRSDWLWLMSIYFHVIGCDGTKKWQYVQKLWGFTYKGKKKLHFQFNALKKKNSLSTISLGKIKKERKYSVKCVLHSHKALSFSFNHWRAHSPNSIFSAKFMLHVLVLMYFLSFMLEKLKNRISY